MKIHISRFWRPETEETAGKIGCYLLLGRHRFDSLINDCVSDMVTFEAGEEVDFRTSIH